MFEVVPHTQLKSQYGLTGLREEIDISAHDAMVGFNVEQVEKALLDGLSSGVLRLEQLSGKVVDFGCGRGVSTALLASYGGDVVGVELSEHSIAQGQELEFIKGTKIVCDDGLNYLKTLPAQSLDLVNASMLGPDTAGSLCRDFLNACSHALKPGGVVLITSDFGTMATLERNNPLGTGFVRGGTFIAVRGLDEAIPLYGSGNELDLKFPEAFRPRGKETDIDYKISDEVLAELVKILKIPE